jgi:hypothetical protein
MPLDTVPTTLDRVGLTLTAIFILGAFIALAIAVRSSGPEHEGAAISWSPLADLAGVAQAAAEAPRHLDLRSDHTAQHVRMHLASEHCLPEALDMPDEDAEAVHRSDHMQPEVIAHHSIDELSWTPNSVQRARRELEDPDRRTLVPEWHELIKQINDTREVPVVPGRHTARHAARDDSGAAA